jgi:hypothetical protein
MENASSMQDTASTIGSDGWRNAEEHEPDSELYLRATTFFDSVDWDALISRASSICGVPCSLSEKYSLGQFNLVRRITFSDGESWVARLRLPALPSFFGGREALDVKRTLDIEVATMKFLRYDRRVPLSLIDC